MLKKTWFNWSKTWFFFSSSNKYKQIKKPVAGVNRFFSHITCVHGWVSRLFIWNTSAAETFMVIVCITGISGSWSQSVSLDWFEQKHAGKPGKFMQKTPWFPLDFPFNLIFPVTVDAAPEPVWRTSFHWWSRVPSVQHHTWGVRSWVRTISYSKMRDISWYFKDVSSSDAIDDTSTWYLQLRHTEATSCVAISSRPVVPSGPQWSGYIPEAAKPQFAIGPQKCVVMGPVGELINAASNETRNDQKRWRQRFKNVEREQRSLQRLQWTKWRCVCESLWKWATSKSNRLSDHCKFSLWERQFCRSKVWRNLPKRGPALTPWVRRSADFVRWADEPTSEATVPLGLTRICGPGGLSDKIPLDFFSHCGNSGFTMGKQYNIQYESV